MAYVSKIKTFQLAVNAGGVLRYGLLTYDYTSGLSTLQPTDAAYTPISLTTIDGTYTLLWAEAKKVLAAEILGVSNTAEQDLVDRIGYIDDTVSIDFIDAGAAVVWNIAELVEPEHFQAIKALIKQYLNDLSNIV